MRPGGSSLGFAAVVAAGAVDGLSAPPQPASTPTASSATAGGRMNLCWVMAPDDRRRGLHEPDERLARPASGVCSVASECPSSWSWGRWARGAAGDVRLGGGATVRIVLAILVLRAGQPVSRDALVDALWPEDPPPSARQTVESYVSRLRRALREAGLDGAEIDAEAAGYRLALNGYSVDRDEFERLAANGRDARWRGEPLPRPPGSARRLRCGAAQHSTAWPIARRSAPMPPRSTRRACWCSRRGSRRSSTSATHRRSSRRCNAKPPATRAANACTNC